MRSALAMVIAAAALVAGTRAQQPRQPQFASGLAQPVFEGQPIIRHNVWVEVPGLDSDRDGVNDRIRAQIARPEATDRGMRLPIVLTATPYAGGMMPYPRHDLTGPLYVPGAAPMLTSPAPVAAPPSSPTFGNETPAPDMRASAYERYFLPRGFIFAYADSLGTGHSTGCPTIGGREENLAIKALIDWFNGNGTGYDAEGRRVTATWTTGATTMIGVSYDGTLPIGAATLGVAGLKAIVPIAGVSSYYDHRRSYGTVINSFPTAGTDADTLFDNILSRLRPEVCQYMHDRIVRDEDRTTGDYNAFWEERDYPRAIGANFHAAVLIQHGLNDFNTKPRHAARLWAALQARNIPSRIIWHQGPHGDRLLQAQRDMWLETLNRFWTHYLFGVDNGAERDTKVIVEREDRATLDKYTAWPHPDARAVSLHFGRAGDAGGHGGLSIDAANQPADARDVLIDDSSIDANDLVAAASSKNRLLYKTAPLTAPVHVSGIPDVTLYLSFDRPAGVVSAALVDLKADGTASIVTRGWADPQNRDSVRQTAPVAPGTTYRIAFELQPHDYVFPAGSRIAIAVLSTDRLFTLRPPAGTTLTLDLARSAAALPVVGGATALRASVK